MIRAGNWLCVTGTHGNEEIMKLRYYLRGLGIGMLVAALVLILSGVSGGKMSDEAVKKRASELGMVEKNKSVLEDIDQEDAGQEETDEEQPGAGEDIKPQEPDQEDGTAPSEEGGEMQTPEQKEEVSPEQQETGDTQKDDEIKEQTLAEEIEQRADEVAGRAEEIADNAPKGQVVSFTVVQGESSIEVARKAEEAGLVGSAAVFDRFLIDNGYDKRISIGTYEIRVGETEKEIADKITKSG